MNPAAHVSKHTHRHTCVCMWSK